MENACHGETMFLIIVFTLVLLLGPLAYFFGEDSRTADTRGGWPGDRRR
jgi:hypothetical protein